jgi:hypothetical protein
LVENCKFKPEIFLPIAELIDSTLHEKLQKQIDIKNCD